MAYTTQTSVNASSGSGFDILSDANAMHVAAAGVAAVTVGGGAFVAAAVAPAHIIGGTLATGTLLAGAECKRRTGSYLPFLNSSNEPVVHEIMATEPVS